MCSGFVDTKSYSGSDFGWKNGTKTTSIGKILLSLLVKYQMKKINLAYLLTDE